MEEDKRALSDIDQKCPVWCQVRFYNIAGWKTPSINLFLYFFYTTTKRRQNRDSMKTVKSVAGKFGTSVLDAVQKSVKSDAERRLESEVELDCVSKSITYQWCHYQVHIMCRHLAFAELGHWYFDLIFVIIKQESRFSEFMLGCFSLWTLEIHFGSISSYPAPLNRGANNIIGLYLHLITGLFCAFYQRFLLKGWKPNYSVCSLLYQFGAAAKGEFDLDELLETRK